MLPFVEFPVQILMSHGVATNYFPFYSAFTPTQKYEWLAWTSTVMFQSTFILLYYFQTFSLIDLGRYFLGHLVYDTVFLVAYNRDPLMYLHHLVAMCLCCFVPLSLGPQVLEAAIILERSNILLGCVWLLNRAGHGSTRLVKYLGALALLVYVPIRLVWFPYYLLRVASSEVLWMMGIFIPMNVFWCWKLILYYYRIAFKINSGGDRLV
jgi:hypothetical protein